MEGKMQYDDFVGKVQNLARLGAQGEAVRATRAILEVLSQRLYGGEAKDLAAQLPDEIGIFLEQDGANETFGLHKFYEKVGEKEGVDLPDAMHHARSELSVVQEAVSTGEIDHVRGQLPREYDGLFESA
jgi:uncharacterized protein (DUF2267 family)